MMSGTYRNPTTIYFGDNTEDVLLNELKDKFKSILLVCGHDSYDKSGVNKIIEKLSSGGCFNFHFLKGVRANPRQSDVQDGIQIVKKNGVEFILAVGGGSVIDCAKAISTSAFGDNFLEIFEKKIQPHEVLPIGVILTLSGTGSESSDSSVISANDERKLILSSPLITPRFSILNPRLNISAPIYQRMSGVADAMSHIWERYFSPSDDVFVSTALCEGLLKALIKLGPELRKDPENLNLSSEVIWAAKLAHDNTVGFGRKQDWATHKIAHEVARFSNSPHGAILAVIFPLWMRYVSKIKPQYFIRMAEEIFKIPKSDLNSFDYAIQGIAAYEEVLAQMDLPSKLRDIGLSSDEFFEEIANSAVAPMESKTIGNFVRLDKNDIIQILRSGL